MKTYSVNLPADHWVRLRTTPPVDSAKARSRSVSAPHLAEERAEPVAA